MRNIRRRLEAPNPDFATFCTTIVSVIATFSAAIALHEKGFAFGWVATLILTAGVSLASAVAGLRNIILARKNPDLLQAQADADVLVTWQEEARVNVDRDLRARIAASHYRVPGAQVGDAPPDVPEEGVSERDTPKAAK